MEQGTCLLVMYVTALFVALCRWLCVYQHSSTGIIVPLAREKINNRYNMFLLTIVFF
jgi:hypothetical protein